MKKVINGKTYDTDTAKKIGRYCNNYPGGDLFYIDETLYQKRTKEYFLCGEGGAKTKYGTKKYDSYTFGSKIIPLTEAEAKEWCFEHLTAYMEKEYNVDTARKIGSFTNDLPSNDLYYFDETLYQKETNEFFLVGLGGAMTEYGAKDSTLYCSGRKIIPLTDVEAKRWCVEHLSADKVNEIFQ